MADDEAERWAAETGNDISAFRERYRAAAPVDPVVAALVRIISAALLGEDTFILDPADRDLIRSVSERLGGV